MTNSYNTQDNKKVSVIHNRLDKEGLQLMQMLNAEVQEKCKTSIRLFEVLSENFEPQHNETMVPLQYCKLIGQQS